MGYAPGAQHDQPGFAKATSEQSARLLDLMFDEGNTTVLPRMTYNNIETPSWPSSDLNFQDRCEEFIDFIEPLDPYLHIGTNDWKEKGSLKKYFAMRKGFIYGKASFSITKTSVSA